MWSRLRRWRTRRIVAVVVVVLFVVLLPPQQLARRDLRELEADYIASREPTACATQNLLPFAFSQEDRGDEIDRVLLDLIEKARAEAARVRRRFERRGAVFPFPPLRDAHDAVGDALAAQATLYDAMVDDPEHTQDELRTLGLRNTRAERRLHTVRRFVLVDPAREWDRRFVCDEEPPRIPVP